MANRKESDRFHAFSYEEPVKRDKQLGHFSAKGRKPRRCSQPARTGCNCRRHRGGLQAALNEFALIVANLRDKAANEKPLHQFKQPENRPNVRDSATDPAKSVTLSVITAYGNATPPSSAQPLRRTKMVVTIRTGGGLYLITDGK